LLSPEEKKDYLKDMENDGLSLVKEVEKTQEEVG